MKKYTFKAQLARVVNEHQHGPFTYACWQRVQVLTAHILLAFLLYQRTTYKKQVDTDAGQEKALPQKIVQSEDQKQVTSSQHKGKPVSLPELPDSITQNIFIPDSMMQLYEDDEWVLQKMYEQIEADKIKIYFEKLDTVIPIVEKVLPGVDIYCLRDYKLEGYCDQVLEYRGHEYLISELNILYTLTNRPTEVTIKERIECLMLLRYLNYEGFSISNIEETEFTENGTIFYNYRC